MICYNDNTKIKGKFIFVQNDQHINMGICKVTRKEEENEKKEEVFYEEIYPFASYDSAGGHIDPDLQVSAHGGQCDRLSGL